MYLVYYNQSEVSKYNWSLFCAKLIDPMLVYLQLIGIDKLQIYDLEKSALVDSRRHIFLYHVDWNLMFVSWYIH